ncbi:hypothetical protein C0989_009198 [Termitomyces sp. Mn162]|nr:hypothetical protein C0989_009198 [Termitomyces sp. Mn162]
MDEEDSAGEDDIERLVEKTEQEGEKQEPVKEGMSFSFAKVWAADKDSLEEVEDIDQGDSWAQTLQKITADRDKVPIQETALSGRGVKRRAAAISKPNAYRDEPLNGAPNSVRSVKSSVDSEGSGYFGSEIDSDIEEDGEDGEDEAFEPSQPKPKKLLPTEPLPLAPIHSSRVVQFCGLCGTRHGDGPGECVMTEKSENLAEFREMLMLHADDEPWEQRTAAIDAIDRTLYQRGHIQLVVGQPLRPLRKTESSPVRQDMSPANATTEVPTAGMSAVQRDPLPSSASSNEVQSQPQLPSHGSRSNGENAIASSSKRPVSPTTVEQGKAKKTKTASASSLPCPVCERMPHHLIKNCPLVIDGPQSITKQIVRLEKNFDNNSAAAVRVLRKLLSKGKRKERAGDDANQQHQWQNMNYTNPAALPSTQLQLKRNRPPAEHSGQDPPLPKVSSDLVLQVFTHISLRRAGGSAEDYGDNERLIHLGRLVLDAAVTNILFNKRPILTTQEIIVSQLLDLSFTPADPAIRSRNGRQHSLIIS